MPTDYLPNLLKPLLLIKLARQEKCVNVINAMWSMSADLFSCIPDNYKKGLTLSTTTASLKY